MALVGYQDESNYAEVELEPGDHVIEAELVGISEKDAKNAEEVATDGSRAKVVVWRYALDPSDDAMAPLRGKTVWDNTTLAANRLYRYKMRCKVFGIADNVAIDTDQVFTEDNDYRIPVTLEINVISGNDNEGNPRTFENVRNVHLR